MAYAAQTKHLPATTWWLLLANIFWTMAYDTEYAMVDRDDDLRIGMRTSAIFFGRHDVAAVMACYALFIAALAAIGWWQEYGGFYYAGLLIAAALAFSHHPMIRERTREGCFRAFRHNNWVGAAVFAGILADSFPWRSLLGGIAR
jgi:4-hydroxybenzoate polyprenyltransferase